MYDVLSNAYRALESSIPLASELVHTVNGAAKAVIANGSLDSVINNALSKVGEFEEVGIPTRSWKGAILPIAAWTMLCLGRPVYRAIRNHLAHKQ